MLYVVRFYICEHTVRSCMVYGTRGGGYARDASTFPMSTQYVYGYATRKVINLHTIT